jgi:dihydropteroate synthase
LRLRGRFAAPLARNLLPVGRTASAGGEAPPQPPGTLRLGAQEWRPGSFAVMGVINRTPDSFFDQGATYGFGDALAAVARAVDDGADIVDIGGVKAGPGDDVSAAEEIRRVSGLVAAVRDNHPAVVIVAAHAILIDPAHDFGKNTWHSLELTRRLGELTATGWPVLAAVSNKDFIGETLGLPTGERLEGTVAALVICAWLGARVLRVHDVAAARQALRAVTWARGLASGRGYTELNAA